MACECCNPKDSHNPTNFEEQQEHENEYKKNFWSGFLYLSLLIVVFFISLALLEWLPTPLFNNKEWNDTLALTLLAIIYLLSGKPVFIGAWESLKEKNIFDENFLMLFATLASGFLGYYEESVAVMLFFRAGEFLEDVAVNRSKKSISALLNTAPQIALRKKLHNTEEVLEEVSPKDLQVGDIVIVKNGEKIPSDGEILKGTTELNQQAITGESLPISKGVGDSVLAGSINLGELLEVRITKEYAQSSVAKIIELVSLATQNKAKTERFIRNFAHYYTPCVFAFFVFLAIVPPMLGFGDWEEWLYRALVVLMVSCPCALVVSVPLGYFGGLGACSRAGVLIKGANYLEALSQLKRIAFDKTGTLTTGKLKISKIVPYNHFTQEEVLQYASCAESFSNHPIASAINECYKELKSTHTHHLQTYKEIAGKGISAVCETKSIIAGNDRILHHFNIPHDFCEVQENGSVAHIAVDGKYAGYIVIEDTLKPNTEEVLQELRNLGIQDMMILSGDHSKAVEKIANSLKISFKGDLLPEEKLEAIKNFKNQGNGKCAFVGDGINDAPSLANSDVGISIGRGNDVSKESADIVIFSDNLEKIPQSIKIALFTRKIIWQNIIIALVCKLLFMILGIVGVASLWIAVLGDVGVTMLAVLNTLRLLRAK